MEDRTKRIGSQYHFLGVRSLQTCYILKIERHRASEVMAQGSRREFVTFFPQLFHLLFSNAFIFKRHNFASRFEGAHVHLEFCIDQNLLQEA